MKTCNGPCNQTKDDSEFFIKRYKSGHIGLRAYCKTCSKAERDAWRKASPRDNERNKAYNKANAEKIKYQRLIKYWPGSTWEQARDNYAALLDAQNKKCAICRKPETIGKELAVDHHHETGRVRGLLCNACNRAIGLLAEDMIRIEEALIYIHRG